MPTIHEGPALPDADTARIYAGLMATDPPGQPREYAPLALSVRDETGQLTGGLLGATIWGWLSMDALWVDDALRGQGIGAALVRAAEDAARRRGCTRARLDTFDFQARAFYERLGYRVYAQLDGFPAGHVQFHMWKELDAPDQPMGDRR